jgi:catechol 2,3-dioxygenase-like lactoylglutathione lyase family enzyme
MKKAIFALALASSAPLICAPVKAQGQEPGRIELNHFMSAYSVADIEAVTAFYVDKLDFEVVKDVPLEDGRHFRWLKNGTQGIELVYLPDATAGPDRAPPRHLAVRGPGQLMLQVADVAATKAALLAKGVTPVVDITDVPVLGLKLMFVVDPEGNAIEIVQVVAS